MGTVSPRNNPKCLAPLTKFDLCCYKACSITTIWKCHSSPPFRGLPDSRCTKPCSRGATPGEIERLGHRRNTDLRARSASLNEHDAINTPRQSSGWRARARFVKTRLCQPSIGWLLITPARLSGPLLMGQRGAYCSWPSIKAANYVPTFGVVISRQLLC